MLKRIITGGLLVLPLLGIAQTQAPKSNNWWDRELWSRLTTSGSRSIGYQMYKFEGDREAFASLTNYGTGLQRFTDIGSLSVQGSKVFGLLDFRANFTDNRFSDPEQQQYTLNYRKGFYDLSYGTVQASLLSSNRFVNFSRSLDGFVGAFKKGKLETKFISSEARGAARTVTIEGNNTSGPYYLQSGRIIGGTIKVIVDGIELRQGIDYIADVNVGAISFMNRTISPTSTIVASYESYDISGSHGSIRGGGLTYDLGPAGKIGITSVQQLVGAGGANPERLESFQGFGRPGDQYPLQFEPIPASIIVTVDGVIRSFSPVDNGLTEFFLSANVPNIVISRVAIPTTQTLQIRYLPKVVQTVDGDRKVTGFDWRLPVGTKNSGSYLAYSRAGGELKGATSSSGNAEGVDLRLAEGKSTLKVGFRKIEPGFRTIEQTGFNRNEDAADYSWEYFTKGLSSSLKTTNSIISLTSSGNTSSTHLTNTEFSLRYSNPKNDDKKVTRVQSFVATRTRAVSVDDNSLTSLAFRDDYHQNKLTFGYGLEKQTGRGRVNGAITGIGVNSYRTTAMYDAGKNWTVSASASKSNIKTDTVNSNGYDYAIRANMLQTGPWSGGAEYSLSDSGVLASLGGFLNGNSLGYGNNGFGGSGGTGTLSTGQMKARRTAFSLMHQAGESLTVGLAYSNTTSVGAATSNAKIDTFSLNTSWRVNSAHSLVIDLIKVKSNFFNSSIGVSDSDVISGFFTGNPGKFWSYSFGFNALDSGSGQFAQDNVGMSGDISYRIDPKQRLFCNASISRTRGIFPQDDRSLQAGYAYTITPGIALVGRYSFRDLRNLDPLATGGAFRSNGLGVELTFDLSNRR